MTWSGWQPCLPVRAARRQVLPCPQQGGTSVRYYGFYSSVSRGNWKKQDEDERTPLASGIRRIIKRTTDELGQVHPPRAG
jgi:hypothetical protein